MSKISKSSLGFGTVFLWYNLFMLKVTKNPYGFKDLLVYKKSEELQLFCRDLTSKFPKTKTIIALADQMDTVKVDKKLI